MWSLRRHLVTEVVLESLHLHHLPLAALLDLDLMHLEAWFLHRRVTLVVTVVVLLGAGALAAGQVPRAFVLSLNILAVQDWTSIHRLQTCNAT